MFGHVQANYDDLTPEQQQRYNAVYCGLCRRLGQLHGYRAKFGLSYDLTFLTLLLSSLYEPEERQGQFRCGVHPGRKRVYAENICTDYSADMTVALTYYKCLDDWIDDKSHTKKLYSSLLKKSYEQVRISRPEQCEAIEGSIRTLSELENSKSDIPDEAANCFGELMSTLFVFKHDCWEPHLRRLGFGIGKYIYLADAAVDFNADIRKKSYNPLTCLSSGPEELKPVLMAVLADASDAFERLPLVQDEDILRNILYSGIWIKYNRGITKNSKEAKDD